MGASSRDIRLNAKLKVESAVDAVMPEYRETAPCYYEGRANEATAQEFEAVLGRKLPPATRDNNAPLTLLNTLGDAENTRWGKVIKSFISKFFYNTSDDESMKMLEVMILDVPIRNFISMSSGVFTEEMAKGLLMILNGEKPAVGLGKILTGLAGAIRKIPDLLKSI